VTTPRPSPDFDELPTPAVEGLSEVVGPDRVLTSRADRIAYNADCSPRGIIEARGRRLASTMPAVVVQPADVHEVRAVVEWARGADALLIPYGAGSGVCRGTVPGAGSVGDDRPAVIVDLKRLDELMDVDADNARVRVQAGVIGANFETELNRLGLTAGHFPSSIYCSSVGGWVAARSAGQCSSRYGKIEDMVASLEVVTGRGDVLETTPESGVSDRAAGAANPTQLFVGNEGTLGLITEATLHVEPTPTHRAYRGFHMPNIDAGLMAIREIMQAGLRPSVVRLYDAADTLVKGGGTEGAEPGADAERDASDGSLVEKVLDTLPAGLSTEIRKAVERVANDVRGSVLRGLANRPKLVNAVAEHLGAEAFLIVGFDGHDRLIKREAEVAFEMVRSHGEDLGTEPGENWRRHRYDASYKQSPVFEAGTFVDTMEVSAPWQSVRGLYSAVREALARHALVMAHFSHVYRDGTSIYFTFVGGGEDTEEAVEIYEQAWEEALDAAAAAGGSVTHHHGVGAEKAPWTERDHRGGWRRFQRLKQQFDPDGVLNPGKVYAQGDR